MTSKPTYYRKLKQLKEVGVSWAGTDIGVIDSKVMDGFIPIRQSLFRMVGESDRVKKELLKVS